MLNISLAPGVYLAYSYYGPNSGPYGNAQLNLECLNVTIGPSPANQEGVIINLSQRLVNTTNEFIFMESSGNSNLTCTTNITINNLSLIDATFYSYINQVTAVFNNIYFSTVGGVVLTPIDVSAKPLAMPDAPRSSMTLNGGRISNWPIGDDGIAIVASNQCDLIINGMALNNNTGSNMFNVMNASFVMVESVVTANRFRNDMFSLSGTEPSSMIVNCTITYNNATAPGAIVSLYDGDVSIQNTWFQSNKVVYSVLRTLGTMDVSGVTFTNNRVINGSILQASNAVFDMTNSTLYDNILQNSNVMNFYASQVTMSEIIFGPEIYENSVSAPATPLIICTDGDITLVNITRKDDSTLRLIDCGLDNACNVHGDESLVCPTERPSPKVGQVGGIGGSGVSVGSGAIAGMMIGSIIGVACITCLGILVRNRIKRKTQ
ncbi:hypothetical protein SAMD00019534_094680 [Acytostelium subglobosum LB1]|uniref:hypothetical protein n=1 Tax=Acytostelium subglobosum LB1 TaxID=1410327 RepID=UPI000644FB50|nr:hypothetical protein SAMD00019534_094680 [Acytostelium subglobosum LB1]GAM26293.1 hypothetical protein SAMD00019534_094680 [Acytostelium subglobosum LB1]|eukprot:XP_012750847.1 hypothetical protein SAMD00019534_094680 [Acytostelium subglobosum LB1]